MPLTRTINFMAHGRRLGILSVLMVVASIAAIGLKGLNFGLDFTGGTQIELGYERPVPIESIRSSLAGLGQDGAIVVYFGSDTDILIRTRDDLGQQDAEQLVSGLVEQGGSAIEVKRVEYVGPQIGEELREDGGLGMLVALVVVMGYVALRFQYKFSIGAVVALFHDVLITLGMFALFQWEFDLTVLAAVLAIIGYSLNDTIVVFDRIRENFRAIRQTPPDEVINISLTQVLARTLVTSGTTLLVVVVLFFLGGEMIHNFALALLIGIGIGTYSSIYVASNLCLAMNLDRADLVPAAAPEEEDLSEYQ